MSSARQELPWLEHDTRLHCTSSDITFRISCYEVVRGVEATLEFFSDTGWRQLHYCRLDRPVKYTGLFRSTYTKTIAEVASECVGVLKEYAAFLASLPLKIASDGK
jgi:hypothetical protein